MGCDLDPTLSVDDDWEELADYATDDLIEATGLDEERAKALIMAARAPWFAEDNA